MSYDIRLVKLVSGEMVLGEFDSQGQCLKEPAALQSLPTQQGVQMMIMPYGYPFEQEFSGSISATHILFIFEKCPEELKTKYLEARSNLTLSRGGLGGLDLKGGGPGPSPVGLIRGR
ncbi:MAG: hypothetical protein LBO77_05145 [Desulfovibrio sp.]|jgi:hypothetical protein|nr:hypothetical protein [Desulfovibrio sp.]